MNAMANFPLGLIALVVISILIYFGIAHRALDRLRLTDRAALFWIAAIIVGSFIDVPLGSRITINLGGIIAVGLAIYIWVGAGTAMEKIRSIIAAGVTALALFLAGRFLGAEPEQIFIDPIYIYPLVAGIVGYLAGRSRRGAFFAAVMGVLALDIGQLYYLTEVIGETLERVQGGPQTEGRPEELIRNLREPAPEPARKPVSDDGERGEEDE